MRRLFIVGAIVVGTALGGCPAAHDDYPNASCKTDSDCYQGEKCMSASVCVPVTVQDMAVLIPPGSDLASTPPDDMTGTGVDL